MAETDLAERDPDFIDPENSVDLEPRQLDALEKLEDLGSGPRGEGESYDSDPRIRALQLIFEGRLGGPGRGQGRKRQPRVSEALAKRFRAKVDKAEDVIDKALDDDNLKISMDAVRMMVDIENKEAALKIQEEKLDADLESQSKEELIVSLLSLFDNPQVEASIGEVIDLTEGKDFREIEPAQEVEAGRTPRQSRSAAGPEANGSDEADDPRNGRGRHANAGKKGGNPFTAAARRRASD